MRVQAIVVRGDRILMVRHKAATSHWCLPGGALEDDERPSDGALRELKEECNVAGTVVRKTSHLDYGDGDETCTFLVDVGHQEPFLGCDPDVAAGNEVLSEVRWVSLADLAERDRVYLWAAGLLGVGGFLHEVQSWRDVPSYPGTVPQQGKAID
jgi:ADP-ribose pyrophosphatase YjhB (NUDIX family)